MTPSLACKLGEFNIWANAICPGPVDTKMIRDAGAEDAGILSALGNMAPLKGWTMPEDCAEPAVLLASHGARRITGLLIIVDSGLTALSP